MKKRSDRQEEAQHAFLSPSKYTWVNSDPDKVIAMYVASFSQPIGTLLHEFAAERINWRKKLRKHDTDSPYFWLLHSGIPDFAIDMERLFPNLMRYVNDSVLCGMDPEVLLRYSDNCFGTADAVSFSHGVLRIHDLKTGETPAHMEQLEIYAALYCLVNDIPDPGSIEIELRIYQNDEVYVHNPDPDVIAEIMDRIVALDRAIEQKKQEG